MAGYTSSPNFPGTTGGAQSANGGGSTDAFVARLNPALTVLDQATYLGGVALDSVVAIHLTPGEVYVCGQTNSYDFPGTTGGAQATGGGGTNGFVARLNPALTTLGQATYLTGNANVVAQALAIHPTSGEVYVAGQTESTNFPGTTGGAQPARGGGTDGFVARLNPALTKVNQATYLGGSSTDIAYALVIHPTSGEVYVAGQTESTNFPGTTGGAQPATGGNIDAFVARLNSALTTLGQATYLGGSSHDGAYAALAIHPMSGEVYVAGWTSSYDFPRTTGGAQSTIGGINDVFVARLNPALTTLGQATYLGGNSNEVAWALAIRPTSGEVYVAGWTQSTNFPGTTGGAQSTSGGGDYDGFVARLSADLARGGMHFYTLTPCRVLDTRGPTGSYGGPALAGAASRNFVLTGVCGVPAGARSVTANLAVTGGTNSGFLTIYPAGTVLPLFSNINYKVFQTRANNAVILLGASGDINVYAGQSDGTVHFILDVNGYFQ